MNMQDNELDNLFRSKLGNMEVEPSARIWNNISAELGGSKKHTLATAWRIAASVVVVLGIGTWFTLRQPAPVQNQVAAKPVKSTINDMPKAAVPVVNQPLARPQTITQTINQIAKLANRTAAKVKVAAPVQDVPATPATVPAPEQPAPMLAAVANTPAVAHPVVPEMTLTTPAAERNVADTKPMVASAPENNLAQQPEKKKKRGIHSIGGLINAVMAKVDKREDKLIEFTETDEEDSITGINLGLIKVKKEK